MSDLRVNTDIVRKGASVLLSAATSMQQVVTRINNLGNQIGGQYQGQLREKVTPILSAAAGGGSPIQSRSQELSAGLSAKAKAIDEVMLGSFNQAVSAFSGNTWISSSLQGILSKLGGLGLGIGAFILSLGAFSQKGLYSLIGYSPALAPSPTINPPIQTNSLTAPMGIIADGPTSPNILAGLSGCTNYVATKRNINDFTSIPGDNVTWGDAYKWKAEAEKNYLVDDMPEKGAIVVFQQHTSYKYESATGIINTSTTYPIKNSDGSITSGDEGHVAYVEAVDNSYNKGGIRILISQSFYSPGQKSGTPGTIPSPNPRWTIIPDSSMDNVSFIHGKKQ